MGLFVGRSEEQDRFRRVLAEAAGKANDGPDEAYVVLVQGYGGIGKTTLLRRFADIAAGRLPERAAGRFTVFDVDWERDRELHREEYVEFTGPVIWRMMERIRTRLEISARSWGRLERRRLAGFAEFQRQVAKLPELEQRAARLGVGKQVGHRPMTPEQIARVVKAGGELAGVAGVPGVVTSAVNRAVDAAAHTASAVQQGRATQLDPDDYRALVDQVDALVTAFTDGVRALARRRPLVVLLDTCELLGGSGPWLREVMRRSGRRVVWVIGTRLEPELLAAGDSEAARYERELDERRLRTVTLARFDDRTATSYLEQRLGTLSRDVDSGRVIALTQGVPLALDFMCKLLADQLRAGRPLEELYEEVAPDGTVSSVVARMANRYLVHANYSGDSELHQDLTALYGLALIYAEHTPTRSGFPRNPFGDPPWEPRAERPVDVARDPALLAALWDTPIDEVAPRLDELGRRHDFVHSRDGTLHRDVRDAIRLFLLTPTQRVRVTDINERAADYLTGQLSTFRHTTVDDQLVDPSWRTTAAGLVWHTCWVNPPDGVVLLRHLFPPAVVLQPDFARLLLDITTQFAPYCPATDQTFLTGLTGLTARYPTGPSEAARSAMQALTTAPAPDRPLLRGPTEPYLHLLRAQSHRVLDLDLAEQVAELRRAASAVRPASGPTAARIGDIASTLDLFSTLYLSDLKAQPSRLQKAVVAGQKIAARYQPTNPRVHNDLGYTLCDLGRFDEAEAAYREAIRCDPDHAFAHNNLGNTFFQRGRFDKAEAAYQEAIRFDPADAVAHNNLGETLYLRGRFDEAEAAFGEAIRFDPDCAVAYNGLGNTLYLRGRFDEAEAAFGEAIRCDPDYAVSHRGLGAIHLFAGDWGQAQAELSLAGERPRAELLRWVAVRASSSAESATHTPHTVLAVLEQPPSPNTFSSPFALAEIRALAAAGLGDGTEAARTLRSCVATRLPSDRFIRPLYELLALPVPVAGLGELLQIWREIIAEDPQAAGPWGGPNPA